MPDPTSDYAEAVLAGQDVAGPLVRLACERHRRDRANGQARGLRWDPAAAARPINFIERVLRLPENGGPFRLHAWQKFVVGSLYGWTIADGSRRYRSGYVECGKGAGKTPLGAALMLYAFLEDSSGRRKSTRCAERDQSLICFRDASRMVQASPALRTSVEVLEQALFHPASGSS